MLVVLVILDCFIVKSQISLLLGILMRIGYCVSLSTAEAEYIAAGSCYSQHLWNKKLLGDYGLSQETMVVHCDNFSAIDISKNPVQHSKTKHIRIRYHFIKDLVERKVVALEYIPIER